MMSNEGAARCANTLRKRNTDGTVKPFRLRLRRKKLDYLCMHNVHAICVIRTNHNTGGMCAAGDAVVNVSEHNVFKLLVSMSKYKDTIWNMLGTFWTSIEAPLFHVRHIDGTRLTHSRGRSPKGVRRTPVAVPAAGAPLAASAPLISANTSTRVAADQRCTLMASAAWHKTRVIDEIRESEHELARSST